MSQAVMRHQIADYLKCGTGQTATFALCGTGYFTLNEELNPQVETTLYVCDRSASSDVESYQVKFPFEADFFKDQTAVKEVWDIGHNQCVGEDAQREYVRVDLYDPVSGSENTFQARKFLVAVEVSSLSGDPGKKMKVSGNFNAVGDFVAGTFNTQTKTFTATAAS